MTVVRLVVDEGDVPTELGSLRRWLAGEAELQGRVAVQEGSPQPGTLGPLAEAIEVALGPGGAATALATAVIAWLRHRTGRVKISVDVPGGRRVQLDAERVRGLDGPALQEQLEALMRAVRQDGDVGDLMD